MKRRSQMAGDFYMPPSSLEAGLAQLNDVTNWKHPMTDEVHKPAHYALPGYPDIECIDVLEALELDLLLGSAFQYIWRAGRKGDASKTLVDLKKARWYLDRKIKQLDEAAPRRCRARQEFPGRRCAGLDGHDGEHVFLQHVGAYKKPE